MKDIFLPVPGNSFSPPVPGDKIPLRPTLQLVKNLEEAGGSLFKIADMLLQRELPLCDVITLLHVTYETAGCAESRENRAEFLLEKSPALLLTNILVAILDPLHQMGAVHEAETPPGEVPPAQAG